jgi:hypothetical protein
MSINQTTAILFTRNRPEKAINLCNYWLSRAASVMILDAGTTPFIQDYFSGVERVTYFASERFSERSLFASRNLKTEYACINSDDFLISMNGVESAINKLTQKPNLGFVFHSGNFTDYYFESNQRLIQKKIVGETPFERMLSYVKNPSDVAWAGVWRSEFLRNALEVMGESITVFPMETCLHTTNLYLAGSALAQSEPAEDIICLTRHWKAPHDESMQRVRTLKNPFGIDLTNVGDLDLFEQSKSKFLEYLNDKLPSKQKLDLSQLNYLLNYLVEKENGIGPIRRQLKQLNSQSRAFLVCRILKLANTQRANHFTFVFILINRLRMKIRLFINRFQGHRVAWFGSSIISEMTLQEILNYNLKVDYFDVLDIKEYQKMFND